MSIPPHVYGLGVRLAHLLTIVLLAALLLTGLRLAWFQPEFFAPDTARLVDKLTPSGQIHQVHTLLGITFVAVGVFYLVYLILSGEAKRLFLLFLDRRYTFAKKLLYLLTLIVGLIMFVSGVTMYAGLYSAPGGYMFMRYLHLYGAIYLIGFTLAHLLETVLSRRTKVGVIFWSRPEGRFIHVGGLVGGIVIAAFVAVGLHLYMKAPATLTCCQQNRYVSVDGREQLIEWAGADSLTFYTSGGINFDAGVSRVTVKTFHTRRYIFFLVKWTDHTRSFNRHLVKTKGGWVEEVSEYADRFGESIYSEDRLCLVFSRERTGCVASCHLRPPGKLGLHYTDGDTLDTWQWLAVSSNPMEEAADGWWAGYQDGVIGGRHLDNIAAGGFKSNLNEEWHQPYFLPLYPHIRDWIQYGTESYQPYHTDLDTFAIGTRIPAVLVAPASGDRGDVTARGVWRNGEWTVEFVRLLSTGSTFDVRMNGTLSLSIAPFDNADSKHAYHLKPIRLIIK